MMPPDQAGSTGQVIAHVLDHRIDRALGAPGTSLHLDKEDRGPEGTTSTGIYRAGIDASAQPLSDR